MNRLLQPIPFSLPSWNLVSAAFALLLLLRGTPTPMMAQAVSPVSATSLALQHQDFDNALRISAAGLKTTPTDVRLLTLRGIAFQSKGDLPSASALFQQALKLSPDYLPALEADAQLAFQQHDPQARPMLLRILIRQPAEPTAHAMLGALDYQAKDCDDAVRHFQTAESVVLQQPEALMEYGTCLANLKRLSEAIKVLQQAVELVPANPVARYNLALAQSSASRSEEALATLAPLIDQTSPAEDVLTLAAEIAESTNDTQHAVDLLRQAILAHPKDKAAYLQFAYLSYKHSSVKVGLDIINLGIGQLPKDPELYVARGILLSQTADAGRSAEDFETAARLAPTLSFATAAQGISKSQAHNAEAALATFRIAAKQHPDNSLAQYLLAEELSNQAPEPTSPTFTESISAAKSAIALEPQLVAAHDLLADLYLRAGNNDLALAESQQALKLDPNDEQALYHQIFALRKTDQKAEVAVLVKRMMMVRQQKANGATQRNYKLIEASEPQPAAVLTGSTTKGK